MGVLMGGRDYAKHHRIILNSVRKGKSQFLSKTSRTLFKVLKVKRELLQ